MILTACGSHQKLLKSSDSEAKYAAAIDYFEKGDYVHSLQLFQQLINFYKGTEKAEQLNYYFAYCYYKQEDYILASYYFKRFTQNFPRSEFAEEAMFLSAYCYYLDSPRSSLDQTNTYLALTELQLFIEMYPSSERIADCNKYIDLLRAKLQIKAYNIAKLYLRMRAYDAAITSFNNLLRDYPDTEYKEDILYYIMKSYYHYAMNSISKKQGDRLQSAIDSYNELMFQYPETQYRKEANTMHANVLKRTRN